MGDTRYLTSDEIEEVLRVIGELRHRPLTIPESDFLSLERKPQTSFQPLFVRESGGRVVGAIEMRDDDLVFVPGDE